MDDLVTWLRAQLDEDERVARDAEGPWIPLGPSPSDPRPVAEHMRRFDWSRVLREVEAKRRMLDLHDSVQSGMIDRPGPLQCEYCAGLCHSRSGLGCEEPVDALYPCDTVRLLALPYADRPGYQEEWKP